jgi:hypothetical protein
MGSAAEAAGMKQAVEVHNLILAEFVRTSRISLESRFGAPVTTAANDWKNFKTPNLGSIPPGCPGGTVGGCLTIA